MTLKRLWFDGFQLRVKTIVIWLYMFIVEILENMDMAPIFIKNAEKYILYIHLPLIFIPLIGF